MTELLEGVIVFDGVADRRSISLARPDFLIFDPVTDFKATETEAEKAFIVFDSGLAFEPRVAEVTIPGDFLLIDTAPAPKTVDAATRAEVFVIDSVGGPGPEGPTGPYGPPGPPGDVVDPDLPDLKILFESRLL